MGIKLNFRILTFILFSTNKFQHIKQVNCAVSFSKFKTPCEGCPEITKLNYGPSYSNINHNPHIVLYCGAGYPIDWTFHYDEDDNEGLHNRSLKYERSVEDFKNIDSYKYAILISIVYPQRIFLFPNFTCFSTDNTSILTRLIFHENSKDTFNVSAVSTPNDYHVRQNDSDCGLEIFLSNNGYAPGPCFDCRSKPNTKNVNRFDGLSLTAKRHECSSPSLCNSLYHFQQKGRKCVNQPKNTTILSSSSCKSKNNLRYCTDIYDQGYCYISNSLSPFTIACHNNLRGNVIVANFGVYGLEENTSFIGDNGRVPIRKPYFSWNEIEASKMIHIAPLLNGKQEQFIGQNITFHCKISSFYCATNIIYFGVKWNEDEVEYIKKNTITNEDTEMDAPHVTGNLMIFLKSVGNLAVHCFGAVINSSEWINASSTLNVKPVEPPIITLLEKDVPNSSFVMGELKRRLICQWKGHPVTDMYWEYNGQKSANELTFTNNQVNFDTNTSTLHIPEVFKYTTGNYSCNILTFFGTAVKTIWIDAQKPKEVKSFGNWLTASVIIIFGLFIIILFITSKGIKIIHRQKEVIRLLSEDEIRDFKDGNPNYVGGNYVDNLPYDKKLEISTNSFNIDYSQILGSGNFGLVVKGELILKKQSCSYKNLIRKMYENVDCREKIPIAVKMVKPNVEVEYFKALLSEIKVMSYIGHNENVVKFLGACTEDIRDRKVYILVEYCSRGSLEGFLKSTINRDRFINCVEYGRLSCLKFNDNYGKIIRDEKTFSTLNLLKWTLDFARGVKHIHEKDVIHADLAVRNILLSEFGTAKISDFGLSRQLVNCANYVKTSQVPLPFRHMAPESLQRREFSTKSDVWAFAVVVWEIFTLAQTPYGGSNYSIQFMEDLFLGIRLNKPLYATNEIYEFMLQCWKLEPAERLPVEFCIPLLEMGIDALLCMQ